MKSSKLRSSQSSTSKHWFVTPSSQTACLSLFLQIFLSDFLFLFPICLIFSCLWILLFTFVFSTAEECSLFVLFPCKTPETSMKMIFGEFRNYQLTCQSQENQNQHCLLHANLWLDCLTIFLLQKISILKCVLFTDINYSSLVFLLLCVVAWWHVQHHWIFNFL